MIIKSIQSKMHTDISSSKMFSKFKCKNLAFWSLVTKPWLERVVTWITHEFMTKLSKSYPFDLFRNFFTIFQTEHFLQFWPFTSRIVMIRTHINVSFTFFNYGRLIRSINRCTWKINLLSKILKNSTEKSSRGKEVMYLCL